MKRRLASFHFRAWHFLDLLYISEACVTNSNTCRRCKPLRYRFFMHTSLRGRTFRFFVAFLIGLLRRHTPRTPNTLHSASHSHSHAKYTTHSIARTHTAKWTHSIGKTNRSMLCAHQHGIECRSALVNELLRGGKRRYGGSNHAWLHRRLFRATAKSVCCSKTKHAEGQILPVPQDASLACCSVTVLSFHAFCTLYHKASSRSTFVSSFAGHRDEGRWLRSRAGRVPRRRLSSSTFALLGNALLPNSFFTVCQ